MAAAESKSSSGDFGFLRIRSCFADSNLLLVLCCGKSVKKCAIAVYLYFQYK